MKTPRFSLKTQLFVLTTFVIPFCWLLQNYLLFRQEEKAIDEIQSKFEGFKQANSSTFLCGLGVTGVAMRTPPNNTIDYCLSGCWPDGFERVTTVSFTGSEYNDEMLDLIDRFPQLESVSFCQTSVSPEAMEVFSAKNPNIEIYSD